MPASIRINMTGAEIDPAERSARYRAAIDMAEYCDRHGFMSVNVEEHHLAANGWLPSPLTMAGAIAGRTRQTRIGIMALLVSLYDPVRLAEDLAVIDLLSEGRLSFIAGLGYRPQEFHAMDKPFEDRGAWMDHVLDTLLKAWADEPFEYRGETINVTPKPFTRPHPMFLVGGMSKVAASRAARFGLPFAPPVAMPELEAHYHAELKRFGKEGYCYAPPADMSVLFIDENPDAAWEEIGQYFMNEVAEYTSWKQEGLFRPLEFNSDSIDQLRAEKRYEIISPEECIARHRANPEYQATLHPLCGGIPLKRGWDCLHTYVEKVLPALTG